MKDKYVRKLDIQLVDGEFENVIDEQLRSPEQVYEIFGKIKDSAQETVLALYLRDDLTHTVYTVMGVGGQESSLVDTDLLFGLAFTLRARYFILVHNHPKGKAAPSEGDAATMAAINQMAYSNNKPMLDFIIVADDGYWSMFEEAEGKEYAPHNH